MMRQRIPATSQGIVSQTDPEYVSSPVGKLKLASQYRVDSLRIDLATNGPSLNTDYRRDCGVSPADHFLLASTAVVGRF